MQARPPFRLLATPNLASYSSTHKSKLCIDIQRAKQNPLADPTESPSRFAPETFFYMHGHYRLVEIEKAAVEAQNFLLELRSRYDAIPKPIRDLLINDPDFAVCKREFKFQYLEGEAKPIEFWARFVLQCRDDAAHHLLRAASKYLPSERGEMCDELIEAQKWLRRAKNAQSEVAERVLQLEGAVVAHEAADVFLDSVEQQRAAPSGEYAGRSSRSPAELETARGEHVLVWDLSSGESGDDSIHSSDSSDGYDQYSEAEENLYEASLLRDAW